MLHLSVPISLHCWLFLFDSSSIGSKSLLRCLLFLVLEAAPLIRGTESVGSSVPVAANRRTVPADFLASLLAYANSPAPPGLRDRFAGEQIYFYWFYSSVDIVPVLHFYLP